MKHHTNWQQQSPIVFQRISTYTALDLIDKQEYSNDLDVEDFDFFAGEYVGILS
jgi:hypothetical protein